MFTYNCMADGRHGLPSNKGNRGLPFVDRDIRMTRISMQFHIELKYAYLEEGKFRSDFF